MGDTLLSSKLLGLRMPLSLSGLLHALWRSLLGKGLPDHLPDLLACLARGGGLVSC